MRRASMGLTLFALVVLVALPALGGGEKEVSVTGEVIDSACYIRMGAKGASHRECAQQCADAGIPLALLEDGTGKVVWLAAEKDMETPNAALRPYAGQKVTITGSYAERGGAKILVISSIAPAKS